METQIGKCSRCHKTLIREEYEGHTCTPTLKGVRHLDIDFWWESKTAKGETLLVIKGLDGYIYRLTQTRRAEFVALDASDDKLPEPPSEKGLM